MSKRIEKDKLAALLAQRVGADQETASAWIEAFIESLYESLKAGQSVTLKGLGSFYVKPKRDSWVFKFNPGQRLRALFGWTSKYKGLL